MKRNADVRNAYESHDGRPTTRTSVVAYFDLLGYSEGVRQAHQNDTVNEHLRSVASTLREWYDTVRDEFADFVGNNAHRLWELKAFSDNVVIGHPVSRGGEVELGHMLSDIAMLQAAFIIEANLFMRGGIAVGDLYMDDDIVYGTALLDAVASEHEAMFPRVIMHTSAEVAVEGHLKNYFSVESAPHNLILLRDEDGKLFVNYLAAIFEYSMGSVEKWLCRHRDLVAANLDKHRKKPNIWAKYAWVARYHNYFCARIANLPQLSLDVALLTLGASRLHEQ